VGILNYVFVLSLTSSLFVLIREILDLLAQFDLCEKMVGKKAAEEFQEVSLESGTRTAY
jgi:hypothetical protein